jgi:hypothetical protein
MSIKKYPISSSGIEPATVWLLAQCLNQLRHRVLPAIFDTVSNCIRSCNWYYDCINLINLFYNQDTRLKCNLYRASLLSCPFHALCRRMRIFFLFDKAALLLETIKEIACL